MLNDRSQRKAAQKAADRLAAATAILVQDDFWHFQAMLARALDRCTWWMKSELLPIQASVEDRKTVLAALPDEGAHIVASAYGWMEYLISSRQALSGDKPPLDQATTKTMQATWKSLDNGRRELAKLAVRQAHRFDGGHVLAQLTYCKTEADLLARTCPDCMPQTKVDGGVR